jgi:hypothetical protein
MQLFFCFTVVIFNISFRSATDLNGPVSVLNFSKHYAVRQVLFQQNIKNRLSSYLLSVTKNSSRWTNH